MHEHDERSRSDVINTPGEADQHDGGHVMNDLLSEVLQETVRHADISTPLRVLHTTSMTHTFHRAFHLFIMHPDIMLLKMSVIIEFFNDQ